MVQAVLAIEDRRFYDHPGIDPIAIVGAVFNYAFGDKSYMRGASTLTQQLVKNTFLTQDRSRQAQVPGVDHVGRARAAADRRTRSSSSI